MFEPVGLLEAALALPPLAPWPASKLFSISFSIALRTEGDPSALVGVDEGAGAGVETDAGASLPLADPTLMGLALGDGLD
jgi:hypothetical protein